MEYVVIFALFEMQYDFGIAFGVLCDFETYLTVDCTQLLVQNNHHIFNFLNDTFIQNVM